uniref:Citrate transport protein n=1 Tax=Hirondellea gigas TaxID=1518452 RepID=A0A2P2IBT7_9CRUS
MTSAPTSAFYSIFRQSVLNRVALGESKPTVKSTATPPPTPSKSPKKPDRNKSRHPGKAILAGGISGAIEISITYPTEYIKTQMQLFDDRAKAGIIQSVKDTVRNDGPLGLYRGLSCLLFFSVPKNAARFFAFEQLRHRLEDENGHLSTPRTLLAGLGAGVFEAITVVTPMETIKVKLIHDQLSHSKPERLYKNFFHGVYTIVKQNGLKSTYQGLLPTILKQGSNQAIRWAVYKKMQAYLAGPDQSPADIGVPKIMLAGAVAGAASVYGNTPIDVVKTRMQGLDAHKYKTTMHCVRSIWKNEGFFAFYKGTVPRLGRVCADVAIVMVVYEYVMRFLDSVWDTDTK